MNAPYLLVEFLIESFAVDQPKQFQHIEHKVFKNKQLMHLKGRQIPFQDSEEMELVEIDEETGQPIVYVNYECCGKVEKDKPGCQATSIENGSHEPYSETYSKISFENLPIYS